MAPRHPRNHRRRHRMIRTSGSPQRGEPRMKPPILNRRPHSNGPTTQGASWPTPNTDVISTSAACCWTGTPAQCLEGRFPDEIVARIYRRRRPLRLLPLRGPQGHRADFADIYPECVTRTRPGLAHIFRWGFPSATTRTRCHRTLPSRSSCWADLEMGPRLRRKGSDRTGFRKRPVHLAFEKVPAP